MTILEFLNHLDWEMNLYTVNLSWNFENKCPECGNVYYTEDEEYSCYGQSVAEYREYEGHQVDYPHIYITSIFECKITIQNREIKIEHTEIDGGAYESVCEKCK